MSGLIPQPFIDELLLRIDLVELIDGYLPLKKRGISFIACCPFHNEKTPSFNVISKKQFYHCFGCGASGNAISFAMNYLNLGFVEAVNMLAARIGLKVPREGENENNKASFDLYKLLQEVSSYYQKILKKSATKACEYLQQRAVTEEIASRYQLGYAPNGWHNLEKSFASRQAELLATGMLIQNEDGKIYDRYRHRLMFPIHDRHGRIIGFGGRVLDAQEKPKYLNSPETVLFQKNRELYGLHQILSLKQNIGNIIIVEGYMDVLALAQHGISNAVATLGTATSTYHIQLLAKHSKNLIFCFDGDAAGRQAAWRALESTLPHLNEGLEAQFVFLPEKQDPDSLVRLEGSEQFLARLGAAVPLHRFFWESLTHDINLATPAGKTQLIQVAKPYLQKMPAGSYQHILVDELARLTRIQPDSLQQIIADDNPIKIKQKTNIQRSPLRIALALLLQNPEIYPLAKDFIEPHLLDPEEHQLLIRLLQLVSTQSQSNTASLLESWRTDEYFESMNQIAAWSHQVPEKELVKEFIDTLVFLQKQTHERSIRRLIEKSRKQGLTDEERHDLQALLKKRHKQSAVSE